MAENPFQSILNPNAHQANLYDMRMMSMSNRMETPFERGMGRAGSRGGSGSSLLGNMMGMANEPDYSQFTYDPVMRQRAIAAGVNPLEANQVHQNVFLPNTGFFGRHPNLSRALEGGMFAAASTPSSGGIASAGENISNALEGMIGGERARQGLYRQQFARPFEQAGALEQLNDMGEQRQLRQAQIKHYANESDIQADRVQMEREKSEQTRWGVTPVEGGAYLSEPGKAPVFQAGPGRGKGLEGDLDLGTREQLRIAGVDPATATANQLATANKAAQQQAIARSGASAGAAADARIPTQNYTDARKTFDTRMEDYNKKLLKSNDPAAQSQARTAIIMDRMSQGRNDLIPTNKDINDYITQGNQAIQQTVQQETSDFHQKWPQSLEQPRQSKPSSPKTGSAKKGIPTYNPNTGQLE